MVSKAMMRLLGDTKPSKPKRKPKYNNQATTVDGIRFDSHAESVRYQQLKHWQEQGIISNLELQPAYKIADAVLLDGKKQRARFYRADFRYTRTDTGEHVVEDVKGVKTANYKTKRHLVKQLFGIEIKEILI